MHKGQRVRGTEKEWFPRIDFSLSGFYNPPGMFKVALRKRKSCITDFQCTKEGHNASK